MAWAVTSLIRRFRTKAPTILKKAIQQILLTESLGEELRVLYVAVTRAKEKLYLSGSLKKWKIRSQNGAAEQEKAAALSGDQKCRIDARMDSAFCAL